MATIDGKEYLIPTLDVFQEFALASKLSRILSMMSLQKDRSVLEAKFPAAFAALAGELQMTKEDRDEMFMLCLSGVRRSEGGVMSPVIVNGRLMYQDMNMSVVLRIIWEIIVAHKLIDFFDVDPSKSTDQPEGQPESSGSSTRAVG
jgi:hypothetical protein